MRTFIYKIISKIIKSLFPTTIVGKPIKGWNKKIYYEKSQHLAFLFGSTIDYEPEIQSLIRENVKEGSVVFDIGANIGQYALPISEMVGERGRVYSFEPDYKNFTFLQFNKNINRCDNLLCNNYGIGSEDSALEFFRDTETGGRMGSFKKEYVGESYKGFSNIINIKKFDTVLHEYGNPNFVKIDVEGFETEVINGLSNELPDCCFLIEVREETKNHVYEYFVKNGYKCFCIKKNVFMINDAKEIPSFANLFFKK